MKKSFILLALSTLMLAACGGDNTSSIAPSESETPSQQESSNTEGQDSSEVSSQDSSESTSEENPNTQHVVTFHYWDGITKTENVRHGGKVTKPSKDLTEREGYTFVGWFESEEEKAQQFYFGTAIVKDTDIYGRWTNKEKPVLTNKQLDAALHQDYSNSFTSFWSWNEMELGDSDHLAYNVDGYTAVEGVQYDAGAPLGDGLFQYFADYEGQSYQYWSDPKLGDAWIRQGQKFTDNSGYINMGVEENYFTPQHNLPYLKAADFVYDAGAFWLDDQAKIKTLLETTTAFKHCVYNDIQLIQINLDETATYISSISTYDNAEIKGQNDPRTLTKFEQIGDVNFTMGSLPTTKPNPETIKTWYEWKQEEEPTYSVLEKLEIAWTDPAHTSDLVDKSIAFNYVLTPDDVPLTQREFRFEVTAGNADGLDIQYALGSGNATVTGLLPGVYKFRMVDDKTGVQSNELEVTILDHPESSFTNIVYDLEMFDGVLQNYENPEDPAKFTLSSYDSQVFDGYTGSDENPEINGLTTGFMLGVNKSIHNDNPNKEWVSYFDIEVSQEVNAISFLYGTARYAHESNLKYMSGTETIFDAKIAISDDGVNYLPADTINWTKEFMANITSKGLRRCDMKLPKATKHIRIGFDDGFIGKGADVFFTTFGLYNEAA